MLYDSHSFLKIMVACASHRFWLPLIWKLEKETRPEYLGFSIEKHIEVVFFEMPEGFRVKGN